MVSEIIMSVAQFNRPANSTAGEATASSHASVDRGSPAKRSNADQSFSSPKGKPGKVSIVSKPTPMYEPFIHTGYFNLMLHFTCRVVREMADGIIVEDIQDELLKDCYQKLNPQR